MAVIAYRIYVKDGLPSHLFLFESNDTMLTSEFDVSSL